MSLKYEPASEPLHTTLPVQEIKRRLMGWFLMSEVPLNPEP